MFKSKDKLKKLTIDFYNRKDVVQIAKDLLGKILVTSFNDVITSGRIVETEAYNGIIDKACHSYAGKRTARNEHTYSQAATAYIYICYGMHHMFNIVTNEKEIPEVILVRAVEPIEGIETMLERAGKKTADYTLTKGPGNVGKALGLHKQFSGLDLTGDQVYIVGDGYKIAADSVGVSKRIGVEYAADDALLPYRFYIKGNKYVSAKPTK